MTKDCNLCKHARDDLKCQISIDGIDCSYHEKWEPKEKSMEKNEKFEEWYIDKYGFAYSETVGGTAFNESEMKHSFEAGQRTLDVFHQGIREDLTSLESVKMTAIGRKIGETPNCSKCKWSGAIHQLFGSEYRHICNAQAAKTAADVYNNEQCQALYEVEEVE